MRLFVPPSLQPSFLGPKASDLEMTLATTIDSSWTTEAKIDDECVGQNAPLLRAGRNKVKKGAPLHWIAAAAISHKEDQGCTQ
jgi:hypothetical protein